MLTTIGSTREQNTSAAPCRRDLPQDRAAECHGIARSEEHGMDRSPRCCDDERERDDQHRRRRAGEQSPSLPSGSHHEERCQDQQCELLRGDRQPDEYARPHPFASQGAGCGGESKTQRRQVLRVVRQDNGFPEQRDRREEDDTEALPSGASATRCSQQRHDPGEEDEPSSSSRSRSLERWLPCSVPSRTSPSSHQRSWCRVHAVRETAPYGRSWLLRRRPPEMSGQSGGPAGWCW